METLLRVLSEDEKTQVHERSLKILAETGVKVNTAKGQQYLRHPRWLDKGTAHHLRLDEWRRDPY